MHWNRLAGSAVFTAGMLLGTRSAVAQESPPVAPPAAAESRAFGPEELPVPVASRRRGMNIFVPPIGGFGGVSVQVGSGRVGVQVGPSGYDRFGGPAFSGVDVEVFRPRTFYGPPIVYGPAISPSLGAGTVVNPYLGCVDGNCDREPSLPSYTESGRNDLDAVLPPPPNFNSTPKTMPQAPQPGPRLQPPELPVNPSPQETPVPRRAPQSGPQLSPQEPQASQPVAPRFFPTTGPRLLPAGFIPRNGFDIDSGVRPNAPSLPGNDPFGPSRPRDPRDLPPAT